MDAIASLGRAAARSTMEKDAGLAAKAGKGLMNMGKSLFSKPNFTKNVASPFPKGSAIPRTFSPKRTAATAAAGYGANSALGAYDTVSGNYDNWKNPSTGNIDRYQTPGWRRAARSSGNLVSNMANHAKDYLVNPGRTLAEELGYGAEGPDSYMSNVGKPQAVRGGTDASGNPYSVLRQQQKQVWRPDHAAKIDRAKQVLEGLTPEQLQSLGIPGMLGQQAARRQYDGLPDPGPIKRDYSLYNYGI